MLVELVIREKKTNIPPYRSSMLVVLVMREKRLIHHHRDLVC